MSETNLKKDGSLLLEKIKKEYDLLNQKIVSVNFKEAAKDSLIYEKFMPIVDKYQEDLVYISTEIYNIIEKLNSNLVTMFDGIENEISELDGDIVEVDSQDDNEDFVVDKELEGATITTEIIED